MHFSEVHPRNSVLLHETFLFSVPLRWCGLGAEQLPVTTELPITDKLSVPTSMNVNSAFSAQYGTVGGTAEKEFFTRTTSSFDAGW